MATAGAARAESVAPGTAAGEAVHGQEAPRRRSSRSARPRNPALRSSPPPAPRLLPLLSLLREMRWFVGRRDPLVAYEVTKPTHVSFKPFVAASTRRSWKRRGNKGGGAEPARLEARDGRDMLIPQMSEPA